MEQIFMGVIVLAAVLWIKRKQAFIFRWQPTQSTWAAVGTGLLAFLISVILLFVEQHSSLRHSLLYIGIWAVCGVLIPWAYTLLIEKGAPADLGLKKEGWLKSLLISIGLAAFFGMVIVFQADLSNINLTILGRAATVLILGGGLFEAFLFYGFIHIRLEKAFGMLPAIFLTAVIYVAWHAGTQLTLEADYWLGALKLLGVGIMYQAVFSLSYNLLIIWPLFMGAGVMIDFLVNIGELEMVSYGFEWTLATVALMCIFISLLNWFAKRKSQM